MRPFRKHAKGASFAARDLIALAFVSGLVHGAVAQEPGNSQPLVISVQSIGLRPVPMDKLDLLRMPVIQVELEMTGPQQRELGVANTHFREAMQRVFQRAGGDPRKVVAGRRIAWSEAAKEAEAALEPGQRNRLSQVLFQVQGPLAFAGPELARRLELTDDQARRVGAIGEKWRDDALAAPGIRLDIKLAERPKTVEQLQRIATSLAFRAAKERSRKELVEFRHTALEQINEVLTQPQRDRYRAMLGEPFDMARLEVRPPHGLEPDAMALAQAVGMETQRSDPDFDTRVDHPAYGPGATHPRILFDEAHNNFHTASGRYKPFAELARHDGYRVIPNKEKLSAEVLARGDILLVANAMQQGPGTGFSKDECEAVHKWVESGGALLLISDLPPFALAAADLAEPFGVVMSLAVTSDPAHSDPESPTYLIFSRDNHLLGDHPITRGRNESERVNEVETFTGQAVMGPEGSVAFLKLADTARDWGIRRNGNASAAGWAQGLALTSGMGRVVVLGEAGNLSAQLVGLPGQPMGMNIPGIDNRNMALNILHWLSGLTGP